MIIVSFLIAVGELNSSSSVFLVFVCLIKKYTFLSTTVFQKNVMLNNIKTWKNLIKYIKVFF